MKTLLDFGGIYPGIGEGDLAELRKALLQIDRSDTRSKGCRKLRRIADGGNPVLSPIAQGGLASAAFWSGDITQTLYWTQRVILRHPMTPAALWCATLLVSVFRTLGMKRERFEAEGERFRIMRRIALKSQHANDRIFALHELRKELEARDLKRDAELCQEELRDLMGIRGSRTPSGFP
jgi:hypothetical protein